MEIREAQSQTHILPESALVPNLLPSTLGRRLTAKQGTWSITGRQICMALFGLSLKKSNIQSIKNLDVF